MLVYSCMASSSDRGAVPATLVRPATIPAAPPVASQPDCLPEKELAQVLQIWSTNGDEYMLDNDNTSEIDDSWVVVEMDGMEDEWLKYLK